MLNKRERHSSERRKKRRRRKKRKRLKILHLVFLTVLYYNCMYDQVAIKYKDEYEKLQLRLTTKSEKNLILSESYADQKVKFATQLMTINLSSCWI